MPSRRKSIVLGYATLWPREAFDIKTGRKLSQGVKDALREPGVYVLYRDDHPYYVGKTGRPLFNRIWVHANQPLDRYYNFWNFFSVFTVRTAKYRTDVEGILIAAMPTANSSSPQFPRLKLPAHVLHLLHSRRLITVDE
jgi:hypothetical protein